LLILEKNDLPKGWALADLENVITRISNGTTEKQTKTPTKFPVSRIETISNEFIDFNKVSYLKSPSKDLIEKYRLLDGDILFSNINSDSHLGKSAIYQNLDDILLHGMNLLLIRPNQDIVIPIFLNYLFKHYRNLGSFISVAQHAVNQSSINQTKLKKFKIPIPTLNEQKRIVSKIEELFSLISEIEEALEKSENQLYFYEKRIISYGISGTLTKAWRKNNKVVHDKDILRLIYEERRKLLGKKYQEINPEIQNILEIPTSWEWTSLNNITKKIVDGTHHTPIYTESGIPFLSVKDVRDDQIIFDNCKFISEKDHNKLTKRCNPEFNDILITKSGTIGRTAIIKTKTPFSLFVSVALLKIFDDYLCPSYLNYVLKNYVNHLDVSQKIKGGVIKNFHLEDLRLVPIPIPPLAEQNEISKLLEYYTAIIVTHKKSINFLKTKIYTLRTSILKQAFEGKLVPQPT